MISPTLIPGQKASLPIFWFLFAGDACQVFTQYKFPDQSTLLPKICYLQTSFMIGVPFLQGNFPGIQFENFLCNFSSIIFHYFDGKNVFKFYKSLFPKEPDIMLRQFVVRRVDPIVIDIFQLFYDSPYSN